MKGRSANARVLKRHGDEADRPQAQGPLAEAGREARGDLRRADDRIGGDRGFEGEPSLDQERDEMDGQARSR